MKTTHLWIFLLAAGILGGTIEARGAGDESAPQPTLAFLPAHEAMLAKKSQGKIDVYFLGDSITRRWHGNDYPEFQKNWDANFRGWNAANFGWGGDTTQNVLWRLEHGALEGVHPKVVVLMIGTNNLGVHPPQGEEATKKKTAEVVAGIQKILVVVREQAPKAKIVLMGITPRNDCGLQMADVIQRINNAIAKSADGERVRFISINDKLAQADGTLFDGMADDKLHLTVKAYQIWADALKPVLTEWLGPPAKEDHAPPPTGPPKLD